jgi:hypothetical protein
MEYSNYFKNLVSVLKLEKEAMERISQDKSATIWGIVILAVPAVINLILASFTFPSGFGVMFSRFMLWPMFIPVLSVFAVIFLMSFVALKFFKGHGSVIGFFRTVSNAGIVLWISIIPFLMAFFGILDPIGLYNLIWVVGTIWILAVSYQMLQIHHKISQQDAVYVILIAVVGYFIIRNILGGLLVGSAYRFWY